jgi:hypothetical protein
MSSASAVASSLLLAVSRSVLIGGSVLGLHRVYTARADGVPGPRSCAQVW